jgi:hypothetical protein
MQAAEILAAYVIEQIGFAAGEKGLVRVSQKKHRQLPFSTVLHPILARPSPTASGVNLRCRSMSQHNQLRQEFIFQQI